jgi:8-oxo-dGTP diphosphatase
MSRPELSVSGVVIHDGKLLLVRRPDPDGSWAIPGGRVEEGESLVEALQREIMEETGLQISVGALVGFAERIGRPGHQVIMSFFALWGGDGRAVAASDASEVAWVPLSEVESFGLVEGLADFLRRAGII